MRALSASAPNGDENATSLKRHASYRTPDKPAVLTHPALGWSGIPFWIRPLCFWRNNSSTFLFFSPMMAEMSQLARTNLSNL